MMMKSYEESQVELESQFILRLPKEPANILRELLKTNNNLKDRVSIKIDYDMRHGEVRIDHWLLSAKVVDLPTIIESLKTIDGKGFYKTADICQMLICRDEDDPIVEEESTPKTKKKDPYKVDKKHLWPHGITPPTKNVRKRRFRKTLKKKYVEAPEIEREVKRLLRVDNDAASVKWEVINEEDENKVNKGTVIKKEPVDINPTMAEHDIFGGAVSDSEEEEETTMRVLDVDESSQNSADSNSVNISAESKVFNEFSNDIFLQNSPGLMQEMQYYDHPPSTSYSNQNLSKVQIEQRLEELKTELGIIRIRRQQQEAEIENIENHTLRQRFQNILIRLYEEQMDKELEQNKLQEMLKTAV